jgi:uncharacterized membrane protein YkoI
MALVSRFAIAAVSGFALLLALVAARADDAAKPTAAKPQPAQAGHVCLSPKERRAEAETGKLIRLAAAMRAARSRMPGTVVRAQLCRGADGLVYVLTVFAHDGKVAKIDVDAVKGTLIGGL